MKTILHQHSRQSGVALVLVLIFVVLLTGVVTAYLSRSLSNREISGISVKQSNTDELAKSATDLIVGDLKQEIVNGSTATPLANGSVIYLPKESSNTVPGAAMLPVRGTVESIPNLIRTSGQAVSSPGINSDASPLSSTTASINGRSISPSRWNKHYLIPRRPGASAEDTTPTTDYPIPNWVFITNQGPQVLTSPTNTVLGRFAYGIYDESGLLDLNVAGFPSNATPDQNGGKGYLSYADLTTLGLSASLVDSIVGWRNYATAHPVGDFPNFSFKSAADYSNAVMTNTTGFLVVSSSTSSGRTDQAFLSRQELIRFLITTGSNTAADALQYLGNFSRSSDQPSYYPDPNRLKLNPSQDDITNPNLLTILVKSKFTRADGTEAIPGEPLLKHRFPLSRLALLSDPKTNAELIKKYFAMVYRPADGLWDYVDPDDSSANPAVLPTIKTLSQVVDAGREPTFWELLQAGILAGSLGAEITNSAAFPDYPIATGQNKYSARQIFGIGLSIIDQNDADDNPTVLRFAGTDVPAPEVANLFVSGVENLPYILWIAQQHFRDTTTVVAPPTDSYVDGYLMFGLWNPHKNSAAAPAGQFRIRVNGESYISVGKYDTPGYSKVSSPVTHKDTVLQFHTSSTRTFAQIDVLRPSDADQASCSPQAKFPYPPSAPGTSLQVGILTGQVQTPTTPELKQNYALLTNNYNVPLTIVVEKLVGGHWVPYQALPMFKGNYGNSAYLFTEVTKQMNNGTFKTGNGAISPPMVIAFVHSDPRSNRFSMGYEGGGSVPQMVNNSFNIVDTNGSALGFFSKATLQPQFNTGKYFFADYAYNKKGGNYYSDSDNVVRKGDSNPTPPFTHKTDDSPFYYGNARPIMLNRSFRSVAEMGYAFRDDPWRTLNFSSGDSADAGLLDLFCLNENSSSNRAGVLNLNTASREVLRAILSGACKDPLDATGVPMTLSDADQIADAIRVQLGSPNNPKMVIKNAADIPGLIDKIQGTLPDRFKFRREVIARALSDVTGSRTWTVLIDVIAQSGRYGPSAKTLSDFYVEGERRFWVHVALDRFTGQVVDMQMEPVFE